MKHFIQSIREYLFVKTRIPYIKWKCRDNGVFSSYSIDYYNVLNKLDNYFTPRGYEVKSHFEEKHEEFTRSDSYTVPDYYEVKISKRN